MLTLSTFKICLLKVFQIFKNANADFVVRIRVIAMGVHVFTFLSQLREELQINDCLLNTTSYGPIHQIPLYRVTDFPLALFTKSLLYIILI